MLATVLSATVHGLDGRVVRVEVDVAPGLPGFSIVGLADTALLESRERVRGAIRNSGFVFPPRRITVNLAPADLPKAGASLDLGVESRVDEPAMTGPTALWPDLAEVRGQVEAKRALEIALAGVGRS